MIADVELKKYAKKLLSSKSGLDAVIANFIAGESDCDKDDWYVTSQDAASTILDDFKKYLIRLAK